MTIKQQGGIFGRNPTFNDVTATELTTSDLTVNGSASLNNNATVSSNGATLLSVVATGSNDSRIRITAPNNKISYIEFADPDDGDTGEIRYDHSTDTMQFRTNGNVVAAEFTSAGNLAFPSGQGIDFSATSGTGTSELFDDYEEGTYSVTLHDASSTGNASSTTTTGYYTKVGRVVTCSFANLTDISTAGMTSTNVLYMSLPFSAAQDASGSMAISSVSARQATGEGYVVPVVVSGNSRARFYGCRPDNAVSSIRPAELTSGTSDFFNFTMTYIAS